MIMELSELRENETLKISVRKASENGNGIEFEECLYKAMYIYPKPDNPNAQAVDAHAKQIYDAELIERSLCSAWDMFKPLTYMNVQKFFTGENYDLLMSGKIRTVKKDRKRPGTWEPYEEIKQVMEYEYMFNDIFHVPSGSIIECKVYQNSRGREEHLNKIRMNRSRYKSADYFLLAHDRDDYEFDITDFITMSQQGYCRNLDFREVLLNQ